MKHNDFERKNPISSELSTGQVRGLIIILRGYIREALQSMIDANEAHYVTLSYTRAALDAAKAIDTANVDFAALETVYLFVSIAHQNDGWLDPFNGEKQYPALTQAFRLLDDLIADMPIPFGIGENAPDYPLSPIGTIVPVGDAK